MTTEHGYEDKGSVNTNTLIFWLIGLFAAVILGGGGAWLSVIHARTTENEATLRSWGDRLARLEATMNQLEPRMERIERKVDSMDEKLDLVLKRR